MLSADSLLPHQTDFLQRVINSRPPSRFVLDAPPGSGRSTALAAISEFFAGQPEGRVLFVTTVNALASQFLARVRRNSEKNINSRLVQRSDVRLLASTEESW